VLYAIGGTRLARRDIVDDPADDVGPERVVVGQGRGLAEFRSRGCARIEPPAQCRRAWRPILGSINYARMPALFVTVAVMSCATGPPMRPAQAKEGGVTHRIGGQR
jgi:hypothetical protein